MDVDYKDTVAYKIFRQVLDHTWGHEEKISSEDLIELYKTYMSNGGSWVDIMNGDMNCVKILENTLDSFVKQRQSNKR